MLPATRPLLVGVLAPQNLRRDLAVIRRTPPDVVEYRADLQDAISAKRITATLRSLRSSLNLPFIFTLRDTSEGGRFDGGDDLRRELYRATLPFVDAIDIEIANRSLIAALRAELHHHKTTIIASFHDFSETPSRATLDALIRRGFAAGAHIVKIACHCANLEDAFKLLSLPQRHASSPLAIVAMGPLGRALRMIAPAFGSVLGYAAASAAVAPGQLTISELRHAWQLLGAP